MLACPGLQELGEFISPDSGSIRNASPAFTFARCQATSCLFQCTLESWWGCLQSRAESAEVCTGASWLRLFPAKSLSKGSRDNNYAVRKRTVAAEVDNRVCFLVKIKMPFPVKVRKPAALPSPENYRKYNLGLFQEKIVPGKMVAVLPFKSEGSPKGPRVKYVHLTLHSQTMYC